MVYVVIMIMTWLFCGVISNFLMRHQSLPKLFRLLLLLEGLLGLIFILIFTKKS